MRTLIERLAAATSEPIKTFESLRLAGMDTTTSLVKCAKTLQELDKESSRHSVPQLVARMLFGLKFRVTSIPFVDPAHLQFWSMCHVIGHLIVDEVEAAKPDRFKGEFKPLERLYRSKAGKWIVSHPAYPTRLYTGRTREEALGHMMFEMLDPANAGRFA